MGDGCACLPPERTAPLTVLLTGSGVALLTLVPGDGKKPYRINRPH